MAGTGAAVGTGIGFFALVEGVVFILILFLGLAYVWAKGDLDWVLAWEDRSFKPGVPREHAPFTRPSEEGAGDEKKDGNGEEAA